MSPTSSPCQPVCRACAATRSRNGTRVGRRQLPLRESPSTCPVAPPPRRLGRFAPAPSPRSALPGKPRDSSSQAECGRDAGDIAHWRVGEGDELPSSLDARRDGLRAAAIGKGEALGGFAKKVYL